MRTPLVILVILDDLDRLQGEDTIKALSLLSVLKRLRFIKLLLPMERNAVIEHLSKASVHNPKEFINKYLPEQATLTLINDYQMIESIVAKKIEGVWRSKGHISFNNSLVRPVFGALLIKLFSDKMAAVLDKDTAAQTQKVIMPAWAEEWLTPPYSLDSYPIETGNDSLDIFMQAPKQLCAVLRNTSGGQEEFRWQSGPNDKFEDMIVKLVDSKNKERLLAQEASISFYERYVESWIFRYAEQNWELFHIQLRDILGEIAESDIEKQPNAFTGIDGTIKNEVFTRTFNLLFPERRLKEATNRSRKIKNDSGAESTIEKLLGS